MKFGWSLLLALRVCVLQQLSSSSSVVVVDAAVNERTALSRFFDLTDGERWANNTNWKASGVPICSWHGIICAGGASTDDEGVTAIELQNNNLVGRVAKLLYQMEHLKVLNLKDNKLRSGDFEAFAEPETENSIEILNLAGNAITNLAGIGGAPTSLTELHVTANNIQGDFPVELSKLVNLQILYLSFNKLSGSIPTEIGKMTNLESLYMYENDLSGSLPSEIGLLQKLKVFTVAENAITGSLPRTVNDMINIQTFSIHNNEQKKSKLTGTLPWFNKSPFLDQLYLDGNAFTGTIPHQLMRNSNVTSKLVTIGLSYNQFTGSLPDSLLKFSSLFINLAGNQITTIDSAFCTMGAWMSGLVEEHGCDAILCPTKTYSPVGRVTDSATCDACAGAAAGNALGATECDEEEASPDWYILAEFYRDLMGAQWNRTKGWDELNTILAFENLESYTGAGLDVCGNDWAGVDCNTLGQVRQISLSFNNLHGTIPNSIFSLPGLEVLDVSRNPVVFGEDALKNIQKATQLTSLSIGETKVKTLAGLEQAPASLKFLYLDSLSLDDKAFPTELYALTNLELLHLHFMHLSGKLPTELGRLVNLERLNLYNTGLTGTLPTELGLMNKMNWLDLSENAFTGTIPTQLDAMTNLNKLLVHQTGGGFTGKLPLFNKFPKLRDLSLDYNKFTGVIPPQFLQGVANKTRHITVSITNNLLTGIVPATLDNFVSMDIRLEENRFTGVDPALCDNPKWMNGEVGAQSDANPCDAILCPDSFHGDYGKAVGGSLGVCLPCSSATYYGTVQCNDEDPNPAKTILDKLFKDTGGRYWKHHANWTRPSVPICHREGIVCAGDNIVEIELLDNNLKGTIPPEVFDLTEIKLLGFTNNQVDLSFERMDRAQNLVVLKLSNTQVRSLNHLDKAAPSLKEIHLAGNQLDGPIPEVVYDLPHVRKIFLSNNAFTGSLSDSVADMTALQELELAGNKLTGTIPTVLGAFTDLRRLQLSNNELSGNLPTELNNLTLLTALILGGQHSNQKLSGPLVRFSHAPELRTLDLRDNDFSGTIPGNFLDQTAADASVYVNLSNNRIAGTLPASLSQLQSLFIDLSDNQITMLFDGSFDCSNVGGWMDGAVGSLDGSCDAILCIPGSAANLGFQEADGGTPCSTCEGGLLDAPFYGATTCKPHVNKKTEQGLLEEIYIKTNGTEWIDQTGWNSQRSVCTWFGVTCDDKGVSEINLDSNGLEAAEDVSHLFFALPNLKKLDIKGNKVPLDLTKIQSDSPLQVLKLSATGLKSVDGITNAKDLRRLHVTDNDLQGPFPKEFGQLTNLRSLFLSFNSFTGSLPDEIGNLNNLIELYVYGNMISGTIPGETIAKLTKLKDFILSNNYLTGTIPNVFNSLTDLEQLSLYDQQSASLISGTVPNFLGATSLWYFDATNNDLTGSIPNDFLENSIYKDVSEDNDMTVYLSNNELTGALPASLAGFSSLDIQITGNSITEIPDEFCDKSLWMDGKVLGVGCDAIACPPGRYTNVGRQDSASNVCRDCSLLAGDNRYGQAFCEDTSSEKATLVALYEATNGDGWDESTLWRTTSPVCSWAGIECENGSDDDDNGVTGINLEDNNLVGSLPTSIWTLPFLKSLNLKDNFEVHINLEGLSSAENLELMYLSGTRVDSLYGIAQGSAIRQLHLTDCGISGPLPDEIYDMQDSLEGLFIAYNAFTGTISTRIGRLIKLESFYAYDNDFHGTIPTQIGQMSNLHNIVLSENLLTGSIPSQVSSLNNLQLFSAFRRIKPGDRITGRLPAFDKNPKLQDLYIDNNDITGSIPSNFLAASSRAELVTLSHNDLAGVVPQSIVSIDVLSIWLEGNEITAFPPAICNKTFWMDGAIGRDGCSAFLCPVGTHSTLGRANDTITCQGCEEQGAAKYMGNTNCETPDDERKILIQLYQACGGTEWYNSNDWATSTNFCSWHGIECEFGHVISIKLGSNNLVGTPPEAIFDLPELKILELYSNPVNFKFNNIGTASKLTELRLDSTGLESLDGIGKAPALTVLDVRFNNLNKRLNPEVLELEYLRYLNMASNQMTGNLPVDYFSDMMYLKTLRLGSNEFTGGIPSFSANNRLTTLDLSNNNFRSTIPENFLDAQTYSTPIVIDLSSNEIRGDIPVALERFQHLTLYLRENKITGMPDTFCDRNKWNDGGVGKYGCDAILCPPGTFNTIGRKRDGNDCRSCKDGSRLFGRTTCTTPGSTSASRMTTTSLLAVATVAAYLFL